jgi:tetratricopeptide (TPR) repeat protein
VDIIRGAVQVLLVFGRLEDAHALAEYLFTHDPLCVICLMNFTKVHVAEQEFDAAVATAQSAVALAPKNQAAQQLLAVAFLINGNPQSAKAAINQPDTSPLLVDYFTLLANYSLNDQSATSGGDFHARWPNAKLEVATVYAWTGEIDHAFELLDEMLRASTHPHLATIFGGPYDPMLKNLKADPRWQLYLENIGRSSRLLARYDFKITRPE